MANETRTHAAQPDSRNDRRIEDRRDDGSSSTGYALGDFSLEAIAKRLEGDPLWSNYVAWLNKARRQAYWSPAIIRNDQPHHFWLGRDG